MMSVFGVEHMSGRVVNGTNNMGKRRFFPLLVGVVI
jgi:hypothetical protein